jgi:hypothetical protein
VVAKAVGWVVVERVEAGWAVAEREEAGWVVAEREVAGWVEAERVAGGWVAGGTVAPAPVRGRLHQRTMSHPARPLAALPVAPLQGCHPRQLPPLRSVPQQDPGCTRACAPSRAGCRPAPGTLPAPPLQWPLHPPSSRACP